MNAILRSAPLSALVLAAALACAAGAAGAETGAGAQGTGAPGAQRPSNSLSLEQVAGSARGTTASSGRAPSSDSGYRIDSGDGVSIVVYGEPDLSIDLAKVNGDGRISMPLIGELDVRGLTAREIERLVTRELSNGYLKSPSVRVGVEKYRLFYIKGEVKQPGGYNYVEGLTVEKAVALAGGYTERASEKAVTVVREADPSKRSVSAGPDTSVEPGDVVTIGESFF